MTAILAVAVLALLGGAGSAQVDGAHRTEAHFAGGYHPVACRWPAEARRAGVSACCQLDLEIGADGAVVKADGVCTDPSFLEPTLRCLTVQAFIPATSNGKAIQAKQHLEYEWRSTVPAKRNLCQTLKSS